MTINNCSELLTRIQTQVNNASTLTAKEITLLASAVSQITDNRQVSVASSTQLPNINSNNISNGQIIFIEDRLVPVVANNECWVGLDGRVLESDAPSRCLFTWGPNDFGILGDSSSSLVPKSSPGSVAAGGINNWCQVSFRNISAAAIKTDGTLWTWGSNGQGRLGNGTTTNRSSPGTVAGGGTNWCQVSTGDVHMAAIKTDGTLWTWGCNGSGTLGDGTTTNRCSPGTVAGGGTTWCQVSAGRYSIASIKTDGTLWTWGNNTLGKLGDGTTTNRSSPGTVAGGGTTWCQVSATCSHAAAIKTDGSIWTWGCNNVGQLGNGTTTSRCSPGTIAGSGNNWCQVGSGNSHTTTIKTDGTLWTWGGANNVGTLGNGNTTNRSSPGTVAGGGTNWCQVSVGTYHNASIKTDGTLWTWGFNSCGRLGDGTTTNRCSPGTIAGGGATWILSSASGANSGAIRT